MLAVVFLIAGIFGPARSVFAEPLATYPALEVSGRIDGSGATIDAAFDVSVPLSALARPAQGALLAGYAADGRRLFALPIEANGAFHLYVPLSAESQRSLARIALTAGTVAAERVASERAEPAAEIVSLDETRAIVIWNARAFPAVHVIDAAGRRPIAIGAGTSTYEQLSVDTRARRVLVEFSNGVASITRSFTIFGR